MSVKLMALAWSTDLEPPMRLVLLAYADHANDQGDNVYPSREYMAKKTGYSESSVQRITGQLEDAGLIETLSKGHRGQTAVRRINVDHLQKAAHLASLSGESGSSERESGSSDTRKGATGEPPNHQEPSRTVAADPELEPDGSVSAAPHHYCRTERQFVDLPKSECPTSCQPKEATA